MNIESQKEIYFDANFLIYWFIGKEPELKKRARLLLVEFLTTKKELCSSALAFDEAWWGIKNEYKYQKKVNLSCFDNLVFNELKKFTDLILPKLNLIQFVDVRNGIIEAMNYIKTFELKPRDAFHLVVMKHNDITTIVTDDEDFIKKQQSMNIFVQSMFK